MQPVFPRPLVNQASVEAFLIGCLSIGDQYKCHDGSAYSRSTIAKRVRDAEAIVAQTQGDPTISSEHNRDGNYRSSERREALREQIVEELFKFDRLDSDDGIELGAGGAKPQRSEPKAGKQAYIVIGLPASGKSTLVNRISDAFGAVILDSDFAKRKLPEFDDTFTGANLVHKESSTIVFGGSGGAPSLLGVCVLSGLNVVVPTTGQDYSDLCARRDGFVDAGYSVHLTATTLTREQAAKRALERFLATGRYVPLGLIFDAYANDPVMNYYKSRVLADRRWSSFGAISTITNPAVVEDCTNEHNPAHLLKAAP